MAITKLMHMKDCGSRQHGRRLLAQDRWWINASALGGFHRRDVGDVAVITNGVVIDEVAHVLDETVVSDGYVSQGGIVDAGMLYEALAHLHILVEGTDVNLAIEHHAMHVVGFEVF